METTRPPLMGTSVTSEDVVQVFMDFFQTRDHLRIAGAPLVPRNDPTLLFINSGMAPLKDYFTGAEAPPHLDLVNIQGCVRTTDIEDVGDRHHLTYFDMLGSWSIGRYWKQKAIELAFELLTTGFGFPVDRLYATVYAGDPELGIPPDEESIRWWKQVGLPSDQIVTLGQDNFWGPAADFGPCGPCTEVFFDTGEEFGPTYRPGGEFDDKRRYIEIWNAGVFMEYDLQPDGPGPLDIRSVDTGSGLERMVMTLNGCESVYEIDTVEPIVAAVLAQVDDAPGRAVRVVADHLRTVAFIVSAGVHPSNTGAGYVVRRLMRRAIAAKASLGVENFDFGRVLDAVYASCGTWSAHLLQDRSTVGEVFAAEQEAFEAVMAGGLNRLEALTVGDSPRISGDEAFKLFATYGLPIDTIREHTEARGGTIDEEDFHRAYEKHQALSAGNRPANSALADDLMQVAPTDFTGYQGTTGRGRALFMMGSGREVSTATVGEEVRLVMDRSPFYGEGGGQVGDIGVLRGAGTSVEVLDTTKENPGYIVHHAVVREGTLQQGDELDQEVDVEFRRNVAIHHSATHLLIAALREVLGDHVEQAGSKVEPDGLRLDFRHPARLTEEELKAVEWAANRYIRDNHPAETRIMPYADAVAEGALAVFDEKYGDEVRVVGFGDASLELCGGTHVSATGDIGLCVLTSEGSVSAGIRRVTALAGKTALRRTQNHADLLRQVARRLNSSVDQVLPALERRLAAGGGKTETDVIVVPKLEELSEQVEEVADGTPSLVAQLDLPHAALREAAIGYAEDIDGAVLALGRAGDKIRFVVAVSRSKTDQLDARKLIARVSRALNGHGGGKPHLAEGGGDNIEGVVAAGEEFRNALRDAESTGLDGPEPRS